MMSYTHVVFVQNNIIDNVQVSNTGISREYLTYPKSQSCSWWGGVCLIKTYLYDPPLCQLFSHKAVKIDKACYNYRTLCSVVIAPI
jgi:hypothetical protein